MAGELVEQLLPRHMQIIYDINWRFLQEVRSHFGDDWDRISSMSIIEEYEGYKAVRMASLALVASHTVNGVAAIHSELIKETIFKDFYELAHSRTRPTASRSAAGWRSATRCRTCRGAGHLHGPHLDLLSELREHVNDKAFRKKWWASKQATRHAAALLEERCGVTPPEARSSTCRSSASTSTSGSC